MTASIKLRMQQKAKLHNISLDLLTPEELTLLQNEVEQEAKGHIIIDGVLHNPDILYRSISKSK